MSEANIHGERLTVHETQTEKLSEKYGDCGQLVLCHPWLDKTTWIHITHHLSTVDDEGDVVWPTVIQYKETFCLSFSP